MEKSIYRENLEEEARHILEECRIIVPGIQALIGFQLIAVFNEGFYKRITPDEQINHFVATIITVLAMFVLLTPSAYQRIAEPGQVSRFFVRGASHFIFAAMALLRIGLTIDVYVVGRAIGLGKSRAEIIAVCLFIIGWLLWSGIPRAMRYMRRSDRISQS